MDLSFGFSFGFFVLGGGGGLVYFAVIIASLPHKYHNDAYKLW